jgi:pimeloyl-ACP methyl ester carboxylesterase
MGSKIGGNTAVPTPKAVEKKLTDTSGTHKEKFNRVMHILFPEDAVPAMSKSFEADMFKPTGSPEAPASEDVLQEQDLVRKAWETANNVPQQLQQLHIPTMILTGTRDAIVVPKNARILSEAIPGAELIEIQNGGHAMMYQYPVQIANLINSFISQK